MKISEDYLMAFGRIVTNFSYFEFEFKNLFYFVTGIDFKLNLVMIYKLSFNSFLELAKDVINYKYKNDNELKEKFRDLYHKAKKINEDRNKIIHSAWLSDTQNGKEVMKRFKIKPKELKFMCDIEEYSVEDLNKIAEDISVIEKEAFQFYKYVKKAKAN